MWGFLGLRCSALVSCSSTHQIHLIFISLFSSTIIQELMYYFRIISTTNTSHSGCSTRRRRLPHRQRAHGHDATIHHVMTIIMWLHTHTMTIPHSMKDHSCPYMFGWCHHVDGPRRRKASRNTKSSYTPRGRIHSTVWTFEQFNTRKF